MSRRHSEAYDIGERTRIPVRDGTYEPRDIGSQHHLIGHRPGEHAEPPFVVGLRHALEHEATDLLAGEPDHHPRAHHSGLVHRLRHEIVEGSVEVSEGHIDGDARDRELRCERGAVGHLRTAYRLFEQRQLLVILGHVSFLPAGADRACGLRRRRATRRPRPRWRVRAPLSVRKVRARRHRRRSR